MSSNEFKTKKAKTTMTLLGKQRGAAAHLCRFSKENAFSLILFVVLGAALCFMHLEQTQRLTATINVYEAADPDVAAKITNSDTTTTTTTDITATASKEEEFAPSYSQSHQLVRAPPDSSITYQDMDAMCTLKRYPHLFKKFCPVERPSCYLKAFRAYFISHGARENLMGGCPLAEAVCYAKRYQQDVFNVYCNNGTSETKCDYYSLRNHYEQHGMKEKHVWGCD